MLRAARQTKIGVSANSGKTPKTGDTTNLALWFILLFISSGIASLILLLLGKKK